MKTYTVVDAKGEIVKLLTMPEDQLAGNVPEGCAAVDGHVADAYLDPKGTWQAKPPQPDSACAWDPDTKDWVDPRPPSEKQKLAEDTVRQERDRLLAACDWTQLADSTCKDVWVEYRAALRDLPDQPGFPENVVWPTLPVGADTNMLNYRT